MCGIFDMSFHAIILSDLKTLASVTFFSDKQLVFQEERREHFFDCQ